MGCIFRGMEVVAAVQGFSESPADVWHRWFGHPPFKALEMLKLSDLSYSVFDSKTCEYVSVRSKHEILFLPVFRHLLLS